MNALEEFVFGTQYYRPPTPVESEWETDLDNIRKAGFNTIKIWMMWRWHEPREREFRWADTDRLFDLCERLGLKVNVNIMMDSAPDWLYEKHGCYRVTHRGEAVRPIALGAVYIGGVCPCFDDPRVRAEGLRFITEAVNRYRERDALLGWDVWNEPRYLTISRIGTPGGDGLECWCSPSLRSYREWLAARFGTVETLNAALGKAWSDWETVLPPTRYGDYTEMLVWRQWCMHSVTEQVKWAYESVRKSDPRTPAFCHAGGCSVIQHAGRDPSSDFQNSRQVDFYGSSLPCDADPWTAAMICDWVRSVSPYYWVNEIYSSGAQWRNRTTGKDLERWTWTAIAHGAKGILYWQYRAERLGDESAGYGLTAQDGAPTERLSAVSGIANAVTANESLFRELQPDPPQAAILYDARSDILSNIEQVSSADYAYKTGIRGAYALFWLNNLPVDWIPSEALGAESAARYRVIYLPVPLILGDDACGVLARFVERGGTVISETVPGIREPNGWVRTGPPSPCLEELFGCRELSRSFPDGSETFTAAMDGTTRSIRTDGIVARLELVTAVPFGEWSDGSCAAAVNVYGAGRAVTIGTYLGGAYMSFREPAAAELLRGLASRAGVEPFARVEGAAVSVRRSRSGAGKVIAVVNHGPDEGSVSFDCPAAERWEIFCGTASRFTRDERGVGLGVPAGEVVWLRAGAWTAGSIDREVIA